tara:strand:+ start:3164 stop:4438 length:1275 start_codon:yes stop_codon:yes gene_type:complete
MNFNENYILNYLIYSTSFIPLFLLTGPFIPDLILTINSIIFLCIVFIKKDFFYFNNKFVYLFVTFYIILILSSITSEFQYNSLRSSFFYFRYLLFALLIWFLLSNSKNFINIFILIFSLTFIFAIVDGYYQFIYGQSIFGYNHNSEFSVRLILSFDDKMILGGYLARLFPLFMALIFLKYKNKKNLVYFAMIIFITTDILVYLTGERTAFVITMVSGIFFVLFLNNFRLIRLITLIFSLIIISFITINNPQIKERNIDQTLYQLTEEGNNTRMNFFSDHHEAHYTTALNMFLKNPLLGIGPNNFRKLCSEKMYTSTRHGSELACSTHPHNTFIQVLAETGIFAFLIILFIFFSIIFTVLRHFYLQLKSSNKIISNELLCIYLSIIITLMPIIPSQDFFNNWINIIYFLPVGFFLYLTYQKNLDV